jgi:hypothetical protein
MSSTLITVIDQGWGLNDLPLRASNEGLLRPRVARAQETIQSIRSHLHSFLLRSGQAALYCAHRTSTVSSYAFCEQEGHLAAPPLSLPAALVIP